MQRAEAAVNTRPHSVFTPGSRGTQPVAVLQLGLHGSVLGHLVLNGAASALVFDSAWVASAHRPAFTLCGTPAHPASATLFDRPWLCASGLHPVLANLLPEAGLRTSVATQMSIAPEDDFA